MRMEEFGGKAQNRLVKICLKSNPCTVTWSQIKYLHAVHILSVEKAFLIGRRVPPDSIQVSAQAPFPHFMSPLASLPLFYSLLRFKIHNGKSSGSHKVGLLGTLKEYFKWIELPCSILCPCKFYWKTPREAKIGSFKEGTCWEGRPLAWKCNEEECWQGNALRECWVGEALRGNIKGKFSKRSFIKIMPCYFCFSFNGTSHSLFIWWIAG